MIKYDDTLITFTEVPDEISLCLNITNCPCNCIGCFEPWLKDDFGTELNSAVLASLIDSNEHITCVCFMGGDRYYKEIAELVKFGRTKYPHLKWAMYSGAIFMNNLLEPLLDYYKIGPYKDFFGPLNKTTTNQRMYHKINNYWQDITYKFQNQKR